MSEHNVEEVRKHIKVYIGVFLALMVLTVVTVAISYLHLPVGQAIALAMVVATVKASLVACYFMHLINEKKLIYFSLALTVVFFIVLMVLPIATHLNHIGRRW